MAAEEASQPGNGWSIRQGAIAIFAFGAIIAVAAAVLLTAVVMPGFGPDIGGNARDILTWMLGIQAGTALLVSLLAVQLAATEEPT